MSQQAPFLYVTVPPHGIDQQQTLLSQPAMYSDHVHAYENNAVAAVEKLVAGAAATATASPLMVDMSRNESDESSSQDEGSDVHLPCQQYKTNNDDNDDYVDGDENGGKEDDVWHNHNKQAFDDSGSQRDGDDEDNDDQEDEVVKEHVAIGFTDKQFHDYS